MGDILLTAAIGIGFIYMLSAMKPATGGGGGGGIPNPRASDFNLLYASLSAGNTFSVSSCFSMVGPAGQYFMRVGLAQPGGLGGRTPIWYDQTPFGAETNINPAQICPLIATGQVVSFGHGVYNILVQVIGSDNSTNYGERWFDMYSV